MNNRHAYVLLLVIMILSFLITMSIDIGDTQPIHGENMASKNHRIQQVFAKTKTVCIGRFLIDVPEQSVVVYGPSEIPWPIITHIGKAKEKDAMVAARLLEIEAEKRFATGPLRDKAALIGTVIDGGSPGQKIIFGVSKASGRIYRIDSYVTSGDSLFVQRANPIAAKKDETVQTLNTVAMALSSREPLAIPVSSGVCIEGGFIADTEALSHEALNLGVRLTEFPDVHFSLSLTKKDQLVESDALQPRLKQAEEIANRAGQGAWYARIKTFRRGDRQVGGWRGFEILTRKPAQATEEESHEFAFVSQGQPNNPLLPVLDIEFHTGVDDNQIGAVRPSLTDEEAIQAWDKLTSSIRVRTTLGR